MFQKILRRIFSIFKPRKKIIKKQVVFDRTKGKEHTKPAYKGYCELCGEKSYFPNYFYCKYCRKYHCDNHRLPEDHECSGNPTLPPEMQHGGTIITYSSKKNKN